jgi:hypothetical protein
MVMRVIEAKTFSGYGGLRQTELPKPQPAKDRVLVRVTAAGVTPLDHTILSGAHPRAKEACAYSRRTLRPLSRPVSSGRSRRNRMVLRASGRFGRPPRPSRMSAAQLSSWLNSHRTFYSNSHGDHDDCN